jgi:hypothetical protein
VIGLRIIRSRCGRDHPPRNNVRWDIRGVSKLQAPSRKKKTSLSLSESSLSEYEQRSESDDDGKGRTVDKRQKGPKMAATGVNRGRNKMGKDGDDDVVEGPTGEA